MSRDSTAPVLQTQFCQKERARARPDPQSSTGYVTDKSNLTKPKVNANPGVIGGSRLEDSGPLFVN